jgi:hypothetical protein
VTKYVRGERVTILPAPEQRWECPNCTATHVTRESKPHTPFHTCAGLRGLSAPFIAAGTKAKVEAVERGDWVGKELVQTDGEGRPVMSVVTTRDDGQDCAVFAPTARGNAED